jgi:long-chain fatty acid transport protein
MKRTIKLAVVAALALGATSAFATNGSNLIGLGAEARGMGGVGIGMSHGAESGLANGALITTVENTEISFGGTLFMPNVENTNFGSTAQSDADMSVIPEVSIASKINDNLYIGVGMWGTAGMGVDYRNDPFQSNMVTNLQLMQFGVPIAYKVDSFSIAITPVLQYGSLDINYRYDNDNNQSTATINGNTEGVAQDLQFGYNLGIAYEISDLTIGAMYKSQIDMEYKGQLSAAMADFGVAYANDKLSTPAEIGLGLSYKMGESTIAFDYKNVQWSKAKGYEDFAWEDQDVYALGYEYATTGWAVRLGYNYAKSPITEQTGPNNGLGVHPGNLPDYMPALQNMLNLLGFPGIVESHYTVGASYDISKKTSVDLAYIYAPEVTETFQVPNGAGGTASMTTKHSQSSVSAQMTFKF